MLDQVVKFSKTHAQGVILALLATIAAGSIAEGLWIKNLQSLLNEAREISAARAELVDEELRTLERAVSVMGAQIALIKASSTSVSESLEALRKIVDLAMVTGRLTRVERTRLAEATQTAVQGAGQIKRAVERSEDISGVFASALHAEAIQEYESTSHWAQVAVLFGATLGLLLIGGVAVRVYRRARKKASA